VVIHWIAGSAADAGMTESMAGRAAILQLLPLSVAETPKVNVLLGGLPEVLARPTSSKLTWSATVTW
jgi:hypothetical protein